MYRTYNEIYWKFKNGSQFHLIFCWGFRRFWIVDCVFTFRIKGTWYRVFDISSKNLKHHKYCNHVSQQRWTKLITKKVISITFPHIFFHFVLKVRLSSEQGIINYHNNVMKNIFKKTNLLIFLKNHSLIIDFFRNLAANF